MDLIPFLLLLAFINAGDGQRSVKIYISPKARTRNTFSSSSYVFAESNITATSNLAVDGIADPNFFAGSCFHSEFGDANPFWVVDLGRIFNIFSVEVRNRADCCAERLSNVRIDILKSYSVFGSQGAKLCGTIAGGIGPGETSETICRYTVGYGFKRHPVFPAGRFVRISRNGPFLTLCEVEVYVVSKQTKKLTGGACADEPEESGF